MNEIHSLLHIWYNWMVGIAHLRIIILRTADDGGGHNKATPLHSSVFADLIQLIISVMSK